MQEHVIRLDGVINMACCNDLIAKIDAAREEGLHVVVNFAKVIGITSFACRQLLRRSNNDDHVHLEDMSPEVQSALKLHGDILKEEAAK